MGKKTSKNLSTNSWGIAKNYQYADPKMVNNISLVPPMNFNYQQPLTRLASKNSVLSMQRHMTKKSSYQPKSSLDNSALLQ